VQKLTSVVIKKLVLKSSKFRVVFQVTFIDSKVSVIPNVGGEFGQLADVLVFFTLRSFL
jgi:hypothetical protein